MSRPLLTSPFRRYTLETDFQEGFVVFLELRSPEQPFNFSNQTWRTTG
jgi:hypothetical protein